MRLIDADALTKQLEEMADNEWNKSVGSSKGLEDAIDVIETMPTVERPHGEWYTTQNPNHSPFDSTSEVIYVCSQCAYSSGDRITATWNFCPNCGADMREGDPDDRA